MHRISSRLVAEITQALQQEPSFNDALNRLKRKGREELAKNSRHDIQEAFISVITAHGFFEPYPNISTNVENPHDAAAVSGANFLLYLADSCRGLTADQKKQAIHRELAALTDDQVGPFLMSALLGEALRMAVTPMIAAHHSRN